ncbi:MAG TPA: type II secretion system F family protein, partial [Dehalococcoidales bacterium]|nr:type II secretion system F family protein [Dehalococcoidales bacterium]
MSYAGYQLIQLREMASFPTLDKLIARLSPVKPTDIILFYRQLALLIESGLNIVTSLELLEGQCTHRVFKRALSEIVTEVRAGSQLSVALSKHREFFSAIQCQSLKVGEQTGGLEVILRQVADHMEKQNTTQKGLKNAMTYPVIAAVVAVVVIGVMVTFVMPAFAGLYNSLGAELPAMTKIILQAGEVMK